MTQYYALVQTKSHAFFLESHLRHGGVQCELTNVPRDIMTDICNLCVRFTQADISAALEIIKRCRLPGCKVYREGWNGDGIFYEVIYAE